MIPAGRRSIVGLLLAVPVLCAAVGLEFANRRAEPQANLPVLAAAPKLQGLSGLARPGTQRDTWFKDSVARPLFSPDRRPVGSDVHSIRGLPRLTGIVVSGSRRTAIFAAPSGGHSTVVEAGSRVGVYDVTDVADAGVTVVGPEGTTLIRPVFDAAPPPASRPPVPRQPPTTRSEMPRATAQ